VTREYIHPSLEGDIEYSKNLTVAGYQKMVEDLVAAGWHAWLLTFEWLPLREPHTMAEDYMRLRLERFYALSLSRFIRHPKRYATNAFPFMLGMPDRPVPKRQRAKAVALVNGGIHAHTLYLTPPTTRDCSGGAAVFESCASLFVRKCGLMTFHHKPCPATPRKAVAYVLKSLERGRYDDSTLWIFPRAGGEMNRKQRRYAGGGNAR